LRDRDRELAREVRAGPDRHEDPLILILDGPDSRLNPHVADVPRPRARGALTQVGQLGETFVRAYLEERRFILFVVHASPCHGRARRVYEVAPQPHAKSARARSSRVAKTSSTAESSRSIA